MPEGPLRVRIYADIKTEQGIFCRDCRAFLGTVERPGLGEHRPGCLLGGAAVVEGQSREAGAEPPALPGGES
jgi:hypothetical protein